jgi:hypothetical protein
LLRAWRLTRYRAAGFEMRIGRRVPDALRALLKTRPATLLTAWNPRSRRRPLGWNQRMQRQLRQRLRRLMVIEAEGALGRWHEEMLLVAGDPRRVVKLSLLFRQHAVVILRHRAALRVAPLPCPHSRSDSPSASSNRPVPCSREPASS